MLRCPLAPLGAVLLALAVSGCSTAPAPVGGEPAGTIAGSAPPAAPPQSPPPANSSRALRKLAQIVGEITAENGAIWTVKATDGQTYTVTITPQTIFGARKHPATREQFPVGARSRIRGDLNGTTMTAAQVRLPSLKHPDS